MTGKEISCTLQFGLGDRWEWSSVDTEEERGVREGPLKKVFPGDEEVAKAPWVLVSL